MRQIKFYDGAGGGNKVYLYHIPRLENCEILVIKVGGAEIYRGAGLFIGAPKGPLAPKRNPDPEGKNYSLLAT